MEPLLRHLYVLAYRGITTLAIDDLSPISLIVGANNSGKSSILEAVGLFLRPLDPVQWLGTVRNRDVDMPLSDGLWSMFPRSKVASSGDMLEASESLILEGSVRSHDEYRRVSAGAVAIQVVGAPSGDAEQDEQGIRESVLDVRVDVSVDSAPNVSFKFPFVGALVEHGPTWRVFAVNPATHYSTSTTVEHLSRVINAGSKALAVQLLQLFDPEVEDLDVSVLGERKAVRVSHAARGVVDLASFGDGMRRATTLALALTRASQGVLLIDELEVGIHPRVLPSVVAKLLAAAREAEVQIIATTHSLEAVDFVLSCAGDSDVAASLSAYWLDRHEGAHRVRRYDHARLLALREGGLDIR